MVPWWWLIVVAIGVAAIVMVFMGIVTSGSDYDDAMENFWNGVRYAEQCAEKRSNEA